MRAAPPVSVRCGGGPVWRAAQTATLSLAGATALVLGLQWMHAGAGTALSALAVALSLIAWLSWQALHEPDQRLVWDGQRWELQSVSGQGQGQPLAVAVAVATAASVASAAQGAGCAPAVTIDLGQWMLLTVEREPTRQRWCAVRHNGNEAAWGLFRAAVFARAPSDARVLSGAAPE